MNGKDALSVQCIVLGKLAPPEVIERIPQEVRWKVGVIFFEREGENFRKTIDTFPRDPTPEDLLWCLGVEEHRDPREIIPQIICEILDAEDHEHR